MLSRRIKKSLFSLWKCLLYVCDALILLKRPATSSKKKILIVRPDALGDFILFLDAAAALRKFYPTTAYQIILLGNELWTDLARELPYFDTTISFNRRLFLRNILYRLRFLATMRRSVFSILIYPVYSREFFMGDCFARICKADRKIAFQSDLSNITFRQRLISNHWYDKLIDAPGPSTMELQRYGEFVRGLGFAEYRAALPRLPLAANENLFGNKKTIASGKPGANNYYILFLGAGLDGKRWPLENFSALAERLFARKKWNGLLCGGPGEEKLGAELLRETNAPLTDLVGRTSLQELAVKIAGASLLAGNDTGATHMAAALDTPALCILGGGHYGRFFPYSKEVTTQRPVPMVVSRNMECFGCNWRCIYERKLDEAFPCIAQITVEDVWEVLTKNGF